MKIVRPALTLLLLMAVVTGLAYPLVVTGVAQLLFPAQANGSLVKENNELVGSTLIGQGFSSPRYFWSRPSAAGSNGYDATSSGGSNQAPSNPALLQAVKDRIAALQKYPVPQGPVPVDLVTASASGLDPDISPAAALYQVSRVAQARGLAAASVEQEVRRHIRAPLLPGLGESRVNVLALNMALDRMAAATP